MPRRRHYFSALLVAAVLSGCGGGPGTPTPAPIPTPGSSSATTTAQTSATPEPAALTEAKAARAFAEVEVPAGFRLDLQCPPKTAQDKRICATPTTDTVAWSASRAYLGPELPGGSGLTATVIMNLTAAKTEAAADAAYQRRVRGLRAHDGAYDIAVKKNGSSFTPGQRGRGTMTSTTSGGWRGTELNEKFVLVFDTSPTSKKLTSRTRVQRRGVYVLDVSWTAAKAPVIDDLTDLPDRIATALDRS